MLHTVQHTHFLCTRDRILPPSDPLAVLLSIPFVRSMQRPFRCRPFVPFYGIEREAGLAYYSATEQESRFLPLCGFCSVLWLNLHVSLFDLIPS